MPLTAIQHLVRQCVERLVHGNPEELRLAAINGRLSAEEIQHALDDYPGQLTCPDETAYARLHLYDVRPDGWQNVEFELWYDGLPSDLTLSAQVRATPAGGELQIQDIHVL